MGSSSILNVIEEGKRVLQALRMHTPELRVRGLTPNDLATMVENLEQSDAGVLQMKTNLVNQRSTRNRHKGVTQKTMRYLKGHIRNEFNATDPVYQTVFGKTSSGRGSKASKTKLIESTESPPQPSV